MANRSGRVLNEKSILLNDSENEVIFSSLGRGCFTLATAVVQLYLAEGPQRQKWSKRYCGVACFVKDNPNKSYFIRLFDHKSKQSLWEQELYNKFQYKTPKEYFHTFESYDCQVGLNFASEDEASKFKKIVEGKLLERHKRALERKSRREKESSIQQATNSNVSGGPPEGVNLNNVSSATSTKENKASKGIDKGRRKLTKKDISTPTGFSHVSHCGLHPKTDLETNALDTEMKALFTQIGITDHSDVDEDTLGFIYNFVDENGGLSAVREDLARSQPSVAPKLPTEGGLLTLPVHSRGSVRRPPSPSMHPPPPSQISPSTMHSGHQSAHTKPPPPPRAGSAITPAAGHQVTAAHPSPKPSLTYTPPLGHQVGGDLRPSRPTPTPPVAHQVGGDLCPSHPTQTPPVAHQVGGDLRPSHPTPTPPVAHQVGGDLHPSHPTQTPPVAHQVGGDPLPLPHADSKVAGALPPPPPRAGSVIAPKPLTGNQVAATLPSPPRAGSAITPTSPTRIQVAGGRSPPPPHKMSPIPPRSSARIQGVAAMHSSPPVIGSGIQTDRSSSIPSPLLPTPVHVPAPPPPPPPPQVTSATTSLPKTSFENDRFGDVPSHATNTTMLLDQIQRGSTLKPVTQKEKPSGNERGNLLDQIKSGTILNHVDHSSTRHAVCEPQGIVKALIDAMKGREKFLQYSDDDDDDSFEFDDDDDC